MSRFHRCVVAAAVLIACSSRPERSLPRQEHADVDSLAAVVARVSSRCNTRLVTEVPGESGSEEDIPIAVRQYLASLGDGLASVTVARRYPNLHEQLTKPATRAAILRFLRSSDALRDPDVGFVRNSLLALRNQGTREAEMPLVARLSCHSSPHVRWAAHEYELSYFFQTGRRASALSLLRLMLLDESDAVRRAAPGYIERLGAVEELQEYLRDWTSHAGQEQWTHTESYELVVRLLRGAIGRACSNDQDCSSVQRCYTGVPGGYCMSKRPCRLDEHACPGGSVCSPLPNASIPGVCLATCTGADDCRPGYDCGVVELFPGEPSSPRSTTKVCWTPAVGRNQPQLCRDAGGEWKSFPNSGANCHDECDKPAYVRCGRFHSQACDCGPDSCWNDTACVSSAESPQRDP